jgi:hypothetical protein
MKLKLLFFLILFCKLSLSQVYFQNITGGYVGDNITFTASPTAYYLLHRSGTPLFIPELIKLDLNGNYIWSKTITFLGNAVNGTFRIKFDNNALFITGNHTNNGFYKNFLAKLDTSGNNSWTAETDYVEINTNTRLHVVNNGYLLVGHRDYLGTGFDYTYDITLTKIDASGTFQWGKAYGDDTYDFIANSSIMTFNGELMVAGSYGIRSSGSYTPMIARFDANGSLLWMKTFTESSGQYASFRINDIATTSDGNYVMTGNSKDTAQNFDVQVIKISDTGSILWAKQLFKNGWQEYGKSIMEDSQHNIVVSGPYKQSTDYGDYIAKLNLSGTYLSAFKIKETSDDIFYFNSLFNGCGQDIMERQGVGYALSTVYRNVNIAYRHYLVLSDFNGTYSCQQQPNTYSFTNSSMNWSVNNFTILPNLATDITGNSINFGRANRHDSVITICSTTSVNELNEVDASINIFPNPAQKEVNVSISNPENKKMTATLYDLFGKKISEYRLIDQGNLKSGNHFDISTFSKGIYLLKINEGYNQYSRKIIIE